MQQGDFVGANYFRLGQNFSDTALFSLALKYFMGLFWTGHRHVSYLFISLYPQVYTIHQLCHMLQNTEERVYFWSPIPISKSSQKKKEHIFVKFMWFVKKKIVSFSQKRKLSTKEEANNLWLVLTVRISQENLCIMNLHEWTPCIQYFKRPKKTKNKTEQKNPSFSGHYTFSTYPLHISHTFCKMRLW